MAHNNSNLHSQTPKRSGSPTLVKSYLVLYNAASAIGWSYILYLTLVHVFNLDGVSDDIAAVAKPPKASTVLWRTLSSIPFLKDTGLISQPILETRIPSALKPFIQRLCTTYTRVGVQTAFVQSFAVLEVLHALLGLVRSPVLVNAIQVASRLILVWCFADRYPVVQVNPLYGTMVIAWSATEVIRYSFYALSLVGYNSNLLLFLRYTTFYVLYPMGASSEAFLMYATLPSSSPFSSWRSLYQGKWEPLDYIRGMMFIGWWPGLYVMYIYMMKQRRKVLGNGFRAVPKTLKTN